MWIGKQKHRQKSTIRIWEIEDKISRQNFNNFGRMDVPNRVNFDKIRQQPQSVIMKIRLKTKAI